MGGYLVCTEFADDRYGEPAFYLSDNMTGLFNRNDMRSGLYTGETEHRGYSNVFMKVNGQSSQWDRTYEVSSCFLLRTPEAYLNWPKHPPTSVMRKPPDGPWTDSCPPACVTTKPSR